MEKIHTLNSIAAKLGREKRTVQGWYQKAKVDSGRDIGELVDGTRYFNDEERDLLAAYASSQRSPKSTITPQITVDAGNHQIVLAPPELPQEYSLESLRASEVVSFEDPLTVAQQFLAIADQVQNAMEQDIQQREQRLQQTRQAKDAIASKTSELKMEQRFYQERTRNLDANLSSETSDLQASLAALQALGKPQSSAG